MRRVAFLGFPRAAQTPIARIQRSCFLTTRRSPPLWSPRPRLAISCQAVRCYSAPGGLPKDEVQGRIIAILKNFDKVECCILEVGPWLTGAFAGQGARKGYSGTAVLLEYILTPTSRFMRNLTLQMTWDSIVSIRSRSSWPSKRLVLKYAGYRKPILTIVAGVQH